LNPETTFGRKAQTVYRISDFSVVAESDEQGKFAVQAALEKNTNTLKAAENYCAISTGSSSPVGCGLTLNDCRRVTAGLSGMMCVPQ